MTSTALTVAAVAGPFVLFGLLWLAMRETFASCAHRGAETEARELRRRWVRRRIDREPEGKDLTPYTGPERRRGDRRRHVTL